MAPNELLEILILFPAGRDRAIARMPRVRMAIGTSPILVVCVASGYALGVASKAAT